MNIQTFRGPDLQRVSHAVQQALGDDAMIVQTRVIRTRPTSQIEVVAVAAEDVSRLRRRLEPAPLNPGSGRERPLVLALAGPTGAGKTTTLAKLAVHPAAFGEWKVGLLTIDTFRVGAVEQLDSYAQIASLPLEVVYATDEITGALKRLAGCDVILVDTPGRSPRHPDRNAAWMELLAELRPDEVHLVLPASIRLEVAFSALGAYEGAGVSHLLLTKLDEVVADAGVADAAVDLRLPSRWLTDGQEIPADLHSAPPRILAGLGAYRGHSAQLRVSA
jgi:flagellar biosynthesis protein FlhF